MSSPGFGLRCSSSDAFPEASWISGSCSWRWAVLLAPLFTIMNALTLQTRVSVRIQAIITELIFEHALRIRMKAEISDPVVTNKHGENVAVATSDTASQVGAESQGEGSQAGDPVDSVSSSSGSDAAPTPAPVTDKGKDKAPSKVSSKNAAEQTKPAVDKKKEKNLVGRINNLVTSDLSNLEPIGMFVAFART